VPWAVVHVGPAQGFLLLLVLLQWRVPLERVVTLWSQVGTVPAKIVSSFPLDAHIDGSLLYFSSLVSPQYWPTDKKEIEITYFCCFRPFQKTSSSWDVEKIFNPLA
jgi:hypothetical protein